MRRLPFLIIVLLLSLLCSSYVRADIEIPSNIILKTDFRIWQVNFNKLNVVSEYKKLRFLGQNIEFDSNDSSLLAPFLTEEIVEGVDLMKIRSYLEANIAPAILRDRDDVVIRLNEDEKVEFEGTGLYGRKLDIEKAIFLIKEAIQRKEKFVNLPIIREDPVISVLNQELTDLGIIELAASGETDFSGSPYNRINNIKTGLAKFSGHIIKPGEEFVFGEVLGPVNAATGYFPELVIKGDRTLPEYGGGLCQVSTTAYRAILDGGFPVTDRRNHSYAVSYYSPIGLDATVYPPSVDLRFLNDSPNHLLMQSFVIEQKAYYNFYGSKDARKVVMIGPYYSGWRSAPAPKTEYTSDLAPGQKKILGHAVPGVSSAWYRYVEYLEQDKEPFLENIISKYQARPLFYAVGSDSEQNLPMNDAALENGY